MDANNWGPADPKGKPYMEENEPDMEANEPYMETNKNDPEKTDDWRAQLPPDSRHRIVNKIMETLKRRLPQVPPSGQDGLQELKKIAVRLEEKIYSAATNQADYLRKISLKMLTMETKSQHALPKTFPSNVVASHNQVHSLPIQLSANESQWHQLLLRPNIGNNEVSTGVQSNVTGVQQQLQQNLLDIQLGSLSLQTNQPSVHMLQQSEIPLQSESYGNVSNFLQNQEQSSNPLPPLQKMMSKTQSVPEQLQQQQSNQLLQTLQASGQAPPSFLQPQDLTNLQNQLYQSQGSLPEMSFTSLDLTAETRHANGRHWQGGVYQETPHLRQLQWQQQQQLMRLQMQQLMRLQVQQQQLQQSNKRVKTCVGDQQTIAAQTASSLAIDTPDKSATPLLAEFAGSDGARGSATATVSGKSSATMHTIKALLVLFVMVLSIVMVMSSLSLWLLLLD